MREIKFRAYDKLLNKMIYNLKYHRDYKVNSEEELFIVMQFTGLKDKQDKEIYEGDIVKMAEGLSEAWNIYNHNRIFLIKFQEGTFGFDNIDRYNEIEFDSIFGFDIESDCEVIGNIYENLELLK